MTMTGIKLRKAQESARQNFLKGVGTSLASVALAGNIGVMLTGWLHPREQVAAVDFANIQAPK